MSTIARKLDLRDKIEANLEKTDISNALEPLKQQGFIKSYEKVKGLNDVKFIVHREFDDKK